MTETSRGTNTYTIANANEDIQTSGKRKIDKPHEHRRDQESDALVRQRQEAG